MQGIGVDALNAKRKYLKVSIIEIESLAIAQFANAYTQWTRRHSVVL